jgi:hypothetical protein
MRSPPHQERPASSPRAAIRFRGESSQRQNFTPWAPSLRPIYDANGVMWMLYQQSFHPRWGGPRRSTLDRISIHTQDRWTPRQTGQGHLADPVRPPPTGGQTALPRKEQFPPKKVYKPKIREEEVQEMDIDPERTTNLDIIQIGTMNVPVEGSGKRPVVSNNQVVTPTQKGSVANDHEANGSKSRPKCFLPMWCRPGLTHTQRRKLQ